MPSVFLEGIKITLSHLVLDGLGQPLRLDQGDLVDDGVDLEAEGLDLVVPGLENLPRLEVDCHVDLVDVAGHPALADHLAGYPLGFLG